MVSRRSCSLQPLWLALWSSLSLSAAAEPSLGMTSQLWHPQTHPKGSSGHSFLGLTPEILIQRLWGEV